MQHPRINPNRRPMLHYRPQHMAAVQLINPNSIQAEAASIVLLPTLETVIILRSQGTTEMRCWFSVPDLKTKIQGLNKIINQHPAVRVIALTQQHVQIR